MQNDLRRWMTLCEVQVPDTIMEQAAEILLDQIDWSGGEGETVLQMVGYYEEDEDGEPLAIDDTPEYKARLSAWAEERIHDAASTVQYHFHGGDVIHVYRMITAPPNWKPDPNRHPGYYWAWSEKCADAHNGNFRNGNVKWMLEADVHKSQINWVQTLAANASPSSEDECEINILEGAPIKLTRYKRVN